MHVLQARRGDQPRPAARDLQRQDPAPVLVPVGDFLEPVFPSERGVEIRAADLPGGGRELEVRQRVRVFGVDEFVEGGWHSFGGAVAVVPDDGLAAVTC